jgi:hypothetical protein
VRIGDRLIDVKSDGIDENGVGDSSIYTDPGCDPRFSSCDTNSNEEFSNTDSETVESVKTKKLKKLKQDIKGSLAFHYGKKYGVHVPSDTEGGSSCYDPWCPGYNPYHKPDCGDLSCDTISRLYAKGSDGKYSYYDYTSKNSEVDSCDPTDVDCPKKPKAPKSESYISSESEESSESLPSTGTSRSSNSTGEAHSASNSRNDSSSDESEDTESDGSSLSEDLCAHVILQPDHNTDVWGWVEFFAPAIGHFTEHTRVEASVENVF